MRIIILLASFVFVVLLSALPAVAEDGSPGHDHKIVKASDLDKMSPEELREYIQECHDMCRIGKAERLQKARNAQAENFTKQAAVSQWQYDANYYDIYFDINFTTEIIDGYVTMMATSLFDGLTSVEIDLYFSMIIDSIVQNGSQIAYSRSGDLVTANLDAGYDDGDQFTITTYYRGHPTEGGFQAFEFSSHGSPATDIATTLSEPYFARTWWPCKDYPDDKADSVDITIRHPVEFVCASNGTLVSIINNFDGTATTHWHEQYPITTYLVSICVTNYQTFSNWYVSMEGDSMPVDYWVYPENWSPANSAYPVTVDMIGALAPVMGEYPFIEEKYAMSQFTWGGAMEHQTNTSMSSSAYYESIIVHELGHQWYGDMITCENWHEIWMNEGFASYVEALWVESQSGATAYKNYMNGMRYTSGGTIYCQDTTSVWSIFSSRVYDKGAWAVHMLRHIVGDATFFDILATYYDDPRYKWGDITSLEFRDLCEDVSGIDLHDYFDDWIFGEYYPKYRYSYTYAPAGSGNYYVYLHLRQEQTTNPQVFDMPVDVDVWDGTAYHPFVVQNDQRGQNYILYMTGAANPPQSISVDRNDWILKTASSETLKFHLFYDPLADGTQFAPYLDSVIAKGGATPYSYSIIAGSLPTGVELGAATGKFTGTPTESGLFTFTVRAAENGLDFEQAEYTLFIGESTYIPGDADGSGTVDLDDAVYLISYIFTGGPAPTPIDSGDADGSCAVDIDDVVYLIAYIFTGGPDSLEGCVTAK
ncbi:MAG: putative Ig domain-containing protein [candidate division Zixibacteria bacterium]|nr:putative Ig domain-containing protein [candidate division Zixibacteria bacterium]MBU1470625.1 putative Ig domain-containing protein [candidate division Zixibacteria bacterium]MBU2624326.1 putative Ig domain-containing protein [candidate division Zixibacteria bacterium]